MLRYNQNGKLYLSVYGYPAALHIDPVEKKPLYHFMPGTEIFSLGTVGCNFKCSFCQNWSISQAVMNMETALKNKECEIEDLVNTIHESSPYQQYLSPQAIVDQAIQKKCGSIAFTYNEPSIWGEYAHDIAKLAVQHNLKCVYVSNGYMTEEHLKYIKPYVHALNLDLKAWNPKFYRKLCAANVEWVKNSIRKCVEMGFWLEVTTLIIPEENDSDEELASIAEFLFNLSPIIPWHISAFHPDFEVQDKECTPTQTLERAYNIGKKAGLKNIYVGNALLDGKEDTCCNNCGNVLIRRTRMHIKFGAGIKTPFDGTCPKCGFLNAGIWK